MRSPPPHSIVLIIEILHRRVACEENTRFAVGDVLLWNLDLHHRLQRLQLRVLTTEDSHSGAFSIHLGAKLRRVNLVAQEMIIHLPSTVAVEFCPTHLVQIDEGNTLSVCHIRSPLRLGFPNNLALIVVSVARCERHQDGVGSFGTNLADITAQIVAVAVDGIVHLLALVETDNHRIGVDALNDTTSPPRVEEIRLVVMTNRNKHPVAWLQRLANGWPEVGIERSRGHSAQSLVLHRNLVRIEVFREEIAPTPLSVVSVAQRSVAHCAIADEKHHGVLPLARRAWLRAAHQRFGNRVGGVVHHLLSVSSRVGKIVESLRPSRHD